MAFYKELNFWEEYTPLLPQQHIAEREAIRYAPACKDPF